MAVELYPAAKRKTWGRGRWGDGVNHHHSSMQSREKAVTLIYKLQPISEERKEAPENLGRFNLRL